MVTQAEVDRLYKQGHPDGFVRVDARKRLQEVWGSFSEDKMFIIMDLGGDIARWEDNKKICTADHVNRAIAYISSGCVAQAREMHEAKRRVYIANIFRPR